jgi:monoamine oxidase
MTTVTVLGGGLAGLTAAIACAEGGARVSLHEAHNTLGGRALYRWVIYRQRRQSCVFQGCAVAMVDGAQSGSARRETRSPPDRANTYSSSGSTTTGTASEFHSYGLGGPRTASTRCMLSHACESCRDRF